MNPHPPPPSFNRHEFKNFADYLRFKHRRIIPLWPKANGEAERLVQTHEKNIRIALIEGKNWKQELYKFLRQYRATPHSTTHVSPYEALNSRKLKTWLPKTPTTCYKQQLSMFQHPSASLAQRDSLQKQEMKIYTDQKGNAQERKITPEEVVLMKQHKQNKLSTPYNPNPFVVKDTKGAMITASNGSDTVKRNSSHFKVVVKQLLQDHSGKNEGVENPTSVGKEDIPLRRSQTKMKPPVIFKGYVHAISVN